MTNNIVVKVGILSYAENRLWEITSEKKFADIPAKTVRRNGMTIDVLSGEEMVKIIDEYFAKKDVVIVEKNNNLSFIKDPAMGHFLKTHPGMEKDLLTYANQYKIIADAKVGMNPALAEKTIAAVDNLYPDGKYIPKVFNPLNAYHAATDIALTDAKGLSHQIHHDNKAIPHDKAYLLALELLKVNKVPDPHKMAKDKIVHVPEHLVEAIYALPPKQATPNKVNQK